MPKNIFPPETPRIYCHDEWLTFNEYIEKYGGFPGIVVGRHYILFVSKYLDMSSGSGSDLFSIAITTYGDDTIMLNEFYHIENWYGDSSFSAWDAARFCETNDYLSGIELHKVYFMSEIEDYQTLTDKAMILSSEETKLKPLSYYKQWD